MVSASIVFLNHLLVVTACLITLLFCKGKMGYTSACVQWMYGRGGVPGQVRDVCVLSLSRGPRGQILP